MSGPWEQYQDAPADGPWKAYATNDAVAQPAGRGPLGTETTSLLGRAMGQYLESPQAGADVNAGARALLTNEPTQGVMQGVLRSLPATIGGMAAGPAGAAAGEALRQGGVGIAAREGYTAAPSVLDAVGRPILAGGLQKASEVAAPYIERGMAAGLGKIGEGLQGALRYAGVNLAGVKGPSYDVAAQGGAAAVRQFVGAEPSVGDSLAEKVRGLIAGAVQKGEDAYPALIDAAKQNPAYAGKTLNLQSSLGDKVLEIADRYGFQTVPGLKAPPEATKFWRFAQQADGLQNASIDEVFQFQKQLNSLARANAGKPLGSAFGQLKDAVRGLLGSEVPEIGQANASYAAAKALEEQTGKLTGANDLLGYVTKAYRNQADTLQKQALETASQHVPGLSDALGEIRAYQAAQDFAPLVRGLPQTGMGAAALYGGGKAVQAGVGLVTHDPLAQAGAMALGAAGAAVASPRLSLMALQASQAAGPALASAAAATARAAAAATPALSQAFQHMAPESIAAFYRSPGAAH